MASDIIFITVDAWRYDALGVAGDKYWLKTYGLAEILQTPNLDRFAKQSCYFTHALSAAPHTTVAHASLLTGLWPPQHGVRSFMYERLPEDVPTIAEVLKAQGYTTVALREGENTSEPGILQKVGVLRGFDHIVHSLADVETIAKNSHKAGQPVFAFLHLWDLHAPYLYSPWAAENGAMEATWPKLRALAQEWQVTLPENTEQMELAMMNFQREIARQIDAVEDRIAVLFRWYLEGVNWFDSQRWPTVEKILQKAGMWDNSLICVFGDHGESIHPDGKDIRAFDHGQSLLDDVLRVPLLIRGLPSVAGYRVDEQVSLTDLAPTILHWLTLPENIMPQVNRQRSLLHLFNHEKREDRLHFAELSQGGENFTLVKPSPQYLYQACARNKNYKLLFHQEPIWMKRYLTWTQRIKRKLKRWFRLDKSRPDSANKIRNGSWYWTDLHKDSRERNPRQWGGKLPDEVQMLRKSLEDLYADSRYGNSIDTEDFDSSVVFARLAALGYVED